MDLLATGIYWSDVNGKWRLRIQRPTRFRLDDALRQTLATLAGRVDPVWGDVPHPWLIVPMKVGGAVKGRLWVVGKASRQFDPEEREFVTMVGNQLALAMENSRLYDEVQRLAARRGNLLRRVITAQDERCRRVSRELHDEISQSLAAISLDLDAAQVAGGPLVGGAMERLGDVRERLLSALKEINRIVLDLRPTLLEDMGLVYALRWYAAQRLGSTGVRLHVQASSLNDRLQPHVETTLYRIGQEAITNVAKHAAAQNLWLAVGRTSRHFTLSVRDDGRGFDVSAMLSNPDDRVGLGLFGMKERVALAGGTLNIRSAPGKGTVIAVKMPLNMEVERAEDTDLAG